MSESTAVAIEERKAPSQEIPASLPKADLEDARIFVRDNPPEIVAQELTRLRVKTTMVGKDILTLLNDRLGVTFLAEHERPNAEREGKAILITMLDLDELKITNDTLGHHGGDELLKETANCLKKSVRKTDIVGRWGGDEFLIVSSIDKTGGPEKVEEEVSMIRNRIKENLGPIKASIGTAVWNPDKDFLGAVGEADKLMYQEKRKRKK